MIPDPRRLVGTWGEALVAGVLRPLRRAFGARLAGARRDRRTVVEDVDGLSFLVLPDVFNPVRFRSGAVLARAVREELLGRPVDLPPPRVLDIGTGSGVAAIFAAIRGAEVEAVDVNPQAVRCARLNARLHQVEDRVDVHEGDLFAPLDGRRFDLVLFNPPLGRGEPESFLEAAYRGGDLGARFARGLGGVLAPGGRALVVLSPGPVGEALARDLVVAGFGLEEARRERWLGGLLVVTRCRRR